MYLLDSKLEEIELYSLPATFSGLWIFFFICRGSSGYETLFSLYPTKKSWEILVQRVKPRFTIRPIHSYNAD